MTEEEIAALMNMPYNQIVLLCNDDRDALRMMFSIAIQRGIQQGQQDSHLGYNRMLKRSGASICN